MSLSTAGAPIAARFRTTRSTSLSIYFEWPRYAMASRGASFAAPRSPRKLRSVLQSSRSSQLSRARRRKSAAEAGTADRHSASKRCLHIAARGALLRALALHGKIPGPHRARASDDRWIEPQHCVACHCPGAEPRGENATGAFNEAFLDGVV